MFEEIDLGKQKARFQTVLVLGVEKSGKTRFIGTAPRPVLLYSFDDGWATLAGQEGIEVVRVEGSGKVAEMEKELDSLILKAREYTFPDGRKERYRTIAFDPFSFHSDDVVDDQERLNPSTTDKFKVYGNVQRHHRRFLDKLKKFKYENIIVTSHVILKEDQTTGQQMFMADLQGKTRDSVGAHFDAVLFTKVIPRGNKADYVVCAVPDARRKAGIRIPMGCEDVFANEEKPDFSFLKAKFEAALDAKKGGSTPASAGSGSTGSTVK